MTLLWPWPRCNVWPIIWRGISNWIVWCHSHRRPIKTVASRAVWSQLCHPAFLFCFAGWHGLLQMALEATVLIGRRWEWHQTIRLEIARQIIGQTLHLGQGHVRSRDILRGNNNWSYIIGISSFGNFGCETRVSNFVVPWCIWSQGKNKASQKK